MKTNWNKARSVVRRWLAGTPTLALLVLSGGQPAIAADSENRMKPVESSAEEVRCERNQLTLNECAQRKLHQAQARMDKTFAGLLARVRGTESEPLLKESQDLWLKFREADCRYFASGLTPDGSMVEQIRNDCRALRTEQRTLQLIEMSKCVDAGCPGQ